MKTTKKAEIMNFIKMGITITPAIVISHINKALLVRKLKILLSMFLKKLKKNFYMPIKPNKAVFVTIIVSILSNFG